MRIYITSIFSRLRWVYLNHSYWRLHKNAFIDSGVKPDRGLYITDNSHKWNIEIWLLKNHSGFVPSYKNEIDYKACRWCVQHGFDHMPLWQENFAKANHNDSLTVIHVELYTSSHNCLWLPHAHNRHMLITFYHNIKYKTLLYDDVINSCFAWPTWPWYDQDLQQLILIVLLLISTQNVGTATVGYLESKWRRRMPWCQVGTRPSASVILSWLP